MDKNLFSLSIMWFLGVELRSSGLVISNFTHQTILLGHHSYLQNISILGKASPELLALCSVLGFWNSFYSSLDSSLKHKIDSIEFLPEIFKWLFYGTISQDLMTIVYQWIRSSYQNIHKLFSLNFLHHPFCSVNSDDKDQLGSSCDIFFYTGKAVWINEHDQIKKKEK